MRTSGTPAIAALAAVLAVTPGAAQTPQTPPQQPTFRSRVDLVVLDVRVLDQRGAPVTTLTPSDFEVTVEGRAREVVSVEYQQAGHAFSGEVIPDELRAASQKSSVLLVVDRDNLRTDTSRTMLDGAAAFVERLPPSHDVSLLVLPERGRPSEMGAGRAAVAGQLRRMLGQHNPRNPFPVDEEGIRASLHGVIGRMTARDGRRTVVYLTDRFLPSMSVLDLSRRAALSGVVFYVVTADAPVITAESRSSPGPGNEIRDGLAGLAVSSGGTLLRQIAGADGMFDRLALELSGQYLLSFAADPAADTGLQGIRVRVKRPGLDVHARREFVR